MYSLTVLEAGSLKSKWQKDCSPFGSSRGESFLASSTFKWLFAFLMAASLQSLPPWSFSLLLCMSVSSTFLSLTGDLPLDRESTRRRQWHPTPVLLPGKSHGRRSLVGCSPWGRTESDTTEQLHFHFHFLLSCIGEENGNPLQCSCLENPRDGGAWWAAVSGVVQSWTRLK